MKVNAFGTLLEVVRENDMWVTYFLGEGKKRLAHDIAIPSNLDEKGVLVFLNDLFHEYATPENPEVKKIE